MTAQAVFGPERPAAARAAHAELRNAVAAYEETYGCWGDPSGRKWARVLQAREVAAQYWEYGDSAPGLV